MRKRKTAVPEKLYRKKEVLTLTGLSRSVLHERMTAGTFPKPDLRLSPRVPVWRASTIAAWQAAIFNQGRVGKAA
jgi:predicted DNA-binding transcriptional regulator AlpA